MGVEVTIVDDSGYIKRYITELDEDLISKMVDTAKELDLSCLKFISLDGNTVFNEVQAEEIYKEVDKLIGTAGVDRYLLGLIKDAADDVRLGLDFYLKFKPLD